MSFALWRPKDRAADIRRLGDQVSGVAAGPLGSATSGLHNVYYRVPGFWDADAGRQALAQLYALQKRLEPVQDAFGAAIWDKPTVVSVLATYAADLEQVAAKILDQEGQHRSALEVHAQVIRNAMQFAGSPPAVEQARAQADEQLRREEIRIGGLNESTKNDWPAVVRARADELRDALLPADKPADLAYPEPPDKLAAPADGVGVETAEMRLTGGQLHSVAAGVSAALGRAPESGPKEEPLAATFVAVLRSARTTLAACAADLRELGTGFTESAAAYDAGETAARRAVAAAAD